MKVLFAASEALPFIKVGGLGDVMSALPRQLAREGAQVRVVLPFYSAIPGSLREKAEYQFNFTFPMSWRTAYCGVFRAELDGVIYYLIDNEQYFCRDGIYGEYDDAERFAFFSRAVLEILPLIDYFPDILHANDWHTALVPVYLHAQYHRRIGYERIKTVFSIHNIEFQGKYDSLILGDVFGLGDDMLSLMTQGDCINLMKGAIEASDAVTTVSRTYAQEILDPYFSWGLDPILNLRKYKLRGILNGIDTALFDPQTDAHLHTHYSCKTRQFKGNNKKALQEELSLPVRGDIPVIGMVGRLTPQKGLDLFYPVLHELLQADVQLVVLGSGDRQYEEFFRSCEGLYHDKMRAYIGYSDSMASKIYAGADLFLMPSKFEPCGLSQMIAMRYGTIPVVHEVGGLKDTVEPFNPQEGTGCGVTFRTFNAWDMLDAIWRAVGLMSNKESRRKIMANAMGRDFSWETSAKEYRALYESLL